MQRNKEQNPQNNTNMLQKCVKKLLQNSAVLYAIVGVANTIVGLGTIFVLMYVGFKPEVANVLGYIVGFLNSYFLNKKFTFKSKNSHKRDFVRFGVAMGVAYLINLAVLVILHYEFLVDKYVAQIIASVCYTISGYVISKLWAFKPS